MGELWASPRALHSCYLLLLPAVSCYQAHSLSCCTQLASRACLLPANNCAYTLPAPFKACMSYDYNFHVSAHCVHLHTSAPPNLAGSFVQANYGAFESALAAIAAAVPSSAQHVTELHAGDALS